MNHRLTINRITFSNGLLTIDALPTSYIVCLDVIREIKKVYYGDKSSVTICLNNKRFLRINYLKHKQTLDKLMEAFDTHLSLKQPTDKPFRGCLRLFIEDLIKDRRVNNKKIYLQIKQEWVHTDVNTTVEIFHAGAGTCTVSVVDYLKGNHTEEAIKEFVNHLIYHLEQMRG